MNTEQLRQLLREKWLTYYQENREWLARLGVWVDCNGHRRPSSGFILATLTVLEPRLTQLLPLIVDLSNNPDRIVMALGLNFNPDQEMQVIEDIASPNPVKLLPESNRELPLPNPASRLPTKIDEDCEGSRPRQRGGGVEK
ncbi:MAG: DUF5331 domain-containing protein [Scytolyngbya sp. HA4215-MV1]|nr:DUF5331 domain-containing protein [Scytolyngbya sp. HA4215-MV1]